MKTPLPAMSPFATDPSRTDGPTSIQPRSANETPCVDEAELLHEACAVEARPVEARPVEARAVGEARAVNEARVINVAQPVDKTPPPLNTDSDTLPVIASVSPAEALALSLSPPQRMAIQMLTSGKTAIDSALAAGVSRRTLYRWLKTDANFQAAYNAWQHDAIATARGKILALTDAAIDTVRRALTKGDAKTALVILKSTGILDRPDPGSTDPEEVNARQGIAREQAQTNLLFDKLAAGFPE